MGDEVDDLYGLPLDRFVPERDALAKRVRGDGDRARADEIKALRRPSVAAWGVNQVVRTQSTQARELWKAGDELVAAQDALLGGTGDAKRLRAAGEGEREALDALVRAARGLLTDKGRDLGEATLEKVRDTLHAAAIDPEGREDVAAGRVVKERAHAGLGTFEGTLAASPAPVRERAEPKQKAAKATTKEDRAAQRERERQEAEEAERAEAERRQAARRRAAAERELREAQKALSTAEKRAERTEARLAEAREAAEEAGAELDAARAREENARAALDGLAE